MTDDSPWTDLKAVKDGAQKTAQSLDEFATHSTSRVIGPLATKALERSKAALHRWFGPEPKSPAEARPDAFPDESGVWSPMKLLFRLLGPQTPKEQKQEPPIRSAPEMFDV